MDNLNPLAHPHDQVLGLRDDVADQPDRSEELLALAPAAQGGYYLVPKVIE